MYRITVAVLAVLALVSVSQAAYCHGKPDPNAKPNMNAIYTDAPKFIRSVKNGKLYTVGSGDDVINVVHLYGTAYEMGYAHGELMKDTVVKFVNAVWGYLEGQVESAINGTIHNLQPWFVDLIAEIGMDAALDLTMDATRPYTNPQFYEEMKGAADSSGLPLKKIERIHMIGELTRGDCSMYGAWGNAVKNAGSSLMQMRALDWDVDGPFKDYPQITVYHPVNSTYGHAWANIGWTGWMGSITGMSSQQMAICEIGVAFPDETFGRMSRFGIPFTNILRDILQFDRSLDDSINRIANAHRTCDLILGVGDAKPLGGFRGIEYSASVAKFFDDENMEPTADWHPKIDDVVYYGMDWLCPGYSEVLAKQLNSYHGNITAENTMRYINSITQTGNLHIAVYDLDNMILHTSNARRSDVKTGGVYAYERAYVRIDMNKIFNEQQ